MAGQLRVADVQLAWSRVGEETLVLHLGTSRYFRLNPTASFMWQHLALGAGEVTEGRLLSALTERYAVDASIAASDVATFVDQLRAFGLLRS